jgi:carboxylesterase type B
MENQRHLKPVEVFFGIPYATPPVRSNRFSPTRTPSPWDGVRIADTPGPVCPQILPDISNETAALERMPKGRVEYLKRLLPYLKNQSEDCLYLNIYTPVQGKSKSVRSLYSSPRYTGLAEFSTLLSFYTRLIPVKRFRPQ